MQDFSNVVFPLPGIFIPRTHSNPAPIYERADSARLHKPGASHVLQCRLFPRFILSQQSRIDSAVRRYCNPHKKCVRVVAVNIRRLENQNASQKITSILGIKLSPKKIYLKSFTLMVIGSMKRFCRPAYKYFASKWKKGIKVSPNIPM